MTSVLIQDEGSFCFLHGTLLRSGRCCLLLCTDAHKHLYLCCAIIQPEQIVRSLPQMESFSKINRNQRGPNSLPVLFPLLCFCGPESVTPESLQSSVFCFPAFPSRGFICQDCFLQGHYSSFNLLSSMYRCQQSCGSWLLKQNQYPQALSARALISSKHHLPKYLSVFMGDA